ncbi:MAG: CHRD domain-containing protein [Candidatus Latescibacterota bacterium]|nr:MAG: CHRD domain-containing protein [Candidatus Latescibacterota bacterium]
MRLANVLVAVIVVCIGLAATAEAKSYSATLDGFQVVPPVFTPASGVGGFTLDQINMFEYNVSYGGLVGAEIAAEVCGPALAGDDGPVIFVLPLGPVKFGQYGPLTAQQQADLNAGLWYVIIRSSAYPDGEIRGQIFSTVPVEGATWGAVKALYQID